MLDWCPEPVRVDRARIVVAPWFFRVTGFRRYRGYALWRTILLRSRRGGPWPKRPLQGSDPRV